MSGLEIMLWVCSVWMLGLSFWTMAQAYKPNRVSWHVGLSILATLEALACAWVGSYALTVHLVRLALQ